MGLNAALYTMSAVTVSTTEISITGGTSTIQTKTDNGVFSLFVEVTNMAAGDVYEVALYEKVLSGGTARRVVLATLANAQSDGLFVMHGLHLAIGWDLTLKKISGTDRTFNACVRSIQ